MATKRKGLGRGLEALLGTPKADRSDSTAAQPASAVQTPPTTSTPTELPVEDLVRGRFQPRVDMRQETLKELADSIKAQGVIQPIIVRPVVRGLAGEPRYEIIAGERRWRAAQLAGLADVPVIIREVGDDAAVAMALIENIQREDLNPLEESLALHRLIKEFELTHQEAAEAVGRSRAAVSNLLRLTELAPDVQTLLRSRSLEMGHARALLGVANPAEQVELAKRVAIGKLSVRETERLVRAHAGASKPKAAAAQTVDPNIRRLETELSEKLGARATLRQSSSGKGQLVIDYHSLDELEGILAHIK